MLTASAKTAILHADVNFTISEHTRFTPASKEYPATCVSWHSTYLAKSLAECGDVADPRNKQFAHWLYQKLRTTQAKREPMPFLSERPLVSSQPPVTDATDPRSHKAIRTETQPIQFLSTISAQPGPGYTYFIHHIGWQQGLITKLLASCGNIRDPRNTSFKDWVVNQLLSDYFNGDEMPFLPSDFSIA